MLGVQEEVAEEGDREDGGREEQQGEGAGEGDQGLGANTLLGLVRAPKFSALLV